MRGKSIFLNYMKMAIGEHKIDSDMASEMEDIFNEIENEFKWQSNRIRKLELEIEELKKKL